METHGVPNPTGKQLHGGDRWYQKPFDLLQYYQDFLDHGYAIFSKDPNKELSLELGLVKLHDEFWKSLLLSLPFFTFPCLVMSILLNRIYVLCSKIVYMYSVPTSTSMQADGTRLLVEIIIKS